MKKDRKCPVFAKEADSQIPNAYFLSSLDSRLLQKRNLSRPYSMPTLLDWRQDRFQACQWLESCVMSRYPKWLITIIIFQHTNEILWHIQRWMAICATPESSTSKIALLASHSHKSIANWEHSFANLWADYVQ